MSPSFVKPGGKILFILLVLFLGVFCVYNMVPRNPYVKIHGETVFDNADLKVELIATIPRLAVSYIRKGILFATEDYYIYRQDGQVQKSISFTELGHLPKINPSAMDRIKDFVARLRVTRDIRKKFGAHHSIILKSGTILVFSNYIYRSIDGGKSFHPIFAFEAPNIYGPFPNGAAVDENDNIYFGEYNCTGRPQKIRIIKGSRDGSTWNTFFEFPPGKIFHIHSIIYDPYRNRLWVSTGDNNEESWLMYIDRNTRNLKVLGGGDQGWRIVSLIISKEFLYWCSDDDINGSDIFRYNFLTGKRERILPVGKPSYFSTKLKDGTLIFSTTFEPESIFTKKRKPEPTADLWVSKNGTDWVKIISFSGKPIKSEGRLTRPKILLAGGDDSAEYLFLTPRYALESNFSVKAYKIWWKKASG